MVKVCLISVIGLQIHTLIILFNKCGKNGIHDTILLHLYILGFCGIDPDPSIGARFCNAGKVCCYGCNPDTQDIDKPIGCRQPNACPSKHESYETGLCGLFGVGVRQRSQVPCNENEATEARCNRRVAQGEFVRCGEQELSLPKPG